MQCPQCLFENPDQAKFCLECGAKLQAVCAQCGAALPPQAKFCFECGAKVGAPAAPTPAAPPPPPPPPPATDALLAEALKRLVPNEFAERLLATRGKMGGERRMVTMLFSDVKGSTAMGEQLDPEDVMDIMNGAFEVLIPPVYRHEGTLARLMGDAILAFFGAPLAHEDDAERAVRAALDIVAGAQDYAVRLERERGIKGFNVRVGINTGLVVVGEVGTDLRVEYTAMGDAINLAARMEQNAPVGGVLISHDTYQQVRGLFEVQALEPISVKGKAEPVQVYVVQGARPRAFRMATRGVEAAIGRETRMIGREAELKRFQDAFYLALEDSERQMVTAVGEAGVGKTRLLWEFENWLDQVREPLRYFRGRASPELQNVPYGLLRDVFMLRFDVQDSDSVQTVRRKLEQGFGPALGLDEQGQIKTHIIAQLLGFDFSFSPHLQGLRDDARQLRDRGLIYLGEFFRTVAAVSTVILLLEDIQWADDSSLDAVNALAAALPNQRLLIACLARPTLFDRRPHWGEGQAFHTRIDLQPLSRRDGRRLVEEILQEVEAVPQTLREMVVTAADGNPLYVEELIKVLIEQQVIARSQDGQGPWRVDEARLADLRVPPTLTGVLQARLDSLPLDQRSIMQQAAVVGRTFWDRVVVRIGQSTGEDLGEDIVPGVLSTLRGRDMVAQHETSAFAGSLEFIFKHAALREVAYESILKKVRRGYHGLVADWLIEQSGERAEEYTGLIAEHLEAAGRTHDALTYLERAGEQAAARFANAEAVDFYDRAFKLLGQVEQDARQAQEQEYRLLFGREAAHSLLADRQAQAADLEQLAALAEVLDDDRRRAAVARRQVAYLDAVSDFPAAMARADETIRYSERAGDVEQKINGLVALARALWRQAIYDEAQRTLDEALALARDNHKTRGEADSLQSLGSVLFFRGNMPGARERWDQALALYRTLGAQRLEAVTLGNLVAACAQMGDLGLAKSYSEQALARYQAIGDRRGEATALSNLAGVQHALGDLVAARSYYERCIELCQFNKDRQSESGAVSNLGLVLHDAGDNQAAREHSEKALAIKRAIGDRRGEAYALHHLALALEALAGGLPEGLDAARDTYQGALNLRREIGQSGSAVDDLAGLARVAFTQGQVDQAQALVQEAWDWIAAHGDAGLAYPVRVYLTASDVWAATGQAGLAGEALAAAERFVQDRADRISDEDLRRSFLEQVPLHRELWQRLPR